MDELAVEHHHQTIRQFQQFVEVLADQQHRGATIARGHDLGVDLRDRGEIEPEQGSAAISTSTSPLSSRASTARCTLPPDTR